MGPDASLPDGQRRSIAVLGLLALFAPAMVYVDFWGGRIPEFPSTGVLLSGIAVGAVLGVTLSYGEARDGFGVGSRAFLLAVLLAYGAAFFVSADLAASAEVGLVAFVWGAFVTRVGLVAGPLRGRDAGMG